MFFVIKYVKHLKSETHENFTQNEENYRELRSVISSLPRFSEALSSAKCRPFDNESDFSESDDESSSPFQSTPNMSTTIQFSGSKHKSHFLPIHDLIAHNIKSPQEECELDMIETNEDISDQFVGPSVSSVKANRCVNAFTNYLCNKSDEDSSNNSDNVSEEYLIVN